jgi:hypothetical protein
MHLLRDAVYALCFVAVALAVPSKRDTSPFKDPLFHNTPLRDTKGDVAINAVQEPRPSLDSQMVAMGYKLLASAQINGVETRTWGKSTTSKRYDGPSKRQAPQKNIEGGQCTTECGFANAEKANPDDCKVTYQALYNKATAFSLNPHVVVTAKFGDCAAFFVNNSDQTLVYDHWDMGGTAQWLNGNCLINNNATVGVCRYNSVGSGYSDGAYTSVNNPNYFSTQDM